MTERQADTQLKQLRTDGAGELTSNAFNEFCSQRGILKQVTVPYSSQMNGIAENKQQSLKYHWQARTMLIQANFGTSYWAKAGETANYVLNRLRSLALEGKIPHTLWTGHKPTLKHLRVFGSPAYAYVLDSSARNSILEQTSCC